MKKLLNPYNVEREIPVKKVILVIDT